MSSRIQIQTIRSRLKARQLFAVLNRLAVSCVLCGKNTEKQNVNYHVDVSRKIHVRKTTYASSLLARFRFNNSCAVRIAELCDASEIPLPRETSDLGDTIDSGDVDE